MEMIDKNLLYPLTFEPVYMERMWGGRKMETCLGRTLPSGKAIGESWELSDRDDVQSVVTNGPLKGATLRQICQNYGKNLLGESYRGNTTKFPFLVKIIDAEKRLSLQVHPDETACKKFGDGAEPKTEMWYIMQCEKNAKIIAGMKSSSTKRQFIDTLNSPDVENYLQVFDSRPSDAYFIKAGRIHAIGAGNLLLEIQQNSDTTYRVSDWGRVDENGKPRELHVDKALACLDFMDRTSPRITGVSDSMEHNRKFPILNKCPFFRVDELRIRETWQESTENGESFHLITAVNKPVTVGRGDRTAKLMSGCTCLIPACFGSYSLIIENEEETIVVKTTL